MGPFDIALLAATIRLAAPLIFAATGELISQRAGILNVGLEGMMLVGAFFGFWGAWITGSSWLGIGIGLLAGMALATVMAVLSILARADQMVVGIGLNILALGITTYMFREIFFGRPEVLLGRPARFPIPGLSSLPVVGEVLFRQIPLVYVAFAVVAAAWVLLYRTSWGLTIRAAGELPIAADAAGANITLVQTAGTLTAGALAGTGGALLSVGQVGLFIEGMSAGRGFLAIAAVIFGRWRPLGVLGACLVFGAADALQMRLQAAPTVPRQVWIALSLAAVAYVVATWMASHRLRGSVAGLLVGAAVAATGITLFVVDPTLRLPSQLWLTMPYVITLLVLAGFAGRARMPSALAVPYHRGGQS